MQRWIQQPYGDRKILHNFKYTFEILFLHRHQFIKGFPSRFLIICKDHLLHDRQPLLAKEHVLRPA
ncbi:MAG: hypothetical protein C5S49_02330 [Candidatus Methanogaster sp.]|nr:MAG: hypothetical protein C5S49_02330 [ANME-2 cluster archaeon]